VLSQRTADYQAGVEAFARNHPTQTHVQPHLTVGDVAPGQNEGKMRFIIGVKNPLTIRTAATARQCAPSRRADRYRNRDPSHELGGSLILIDALSSS
jgi:hypothetical protein